MEARAMTSRINREARVEEAFLRGEPLWNARIQRMARVGYRRAKKIMRRLVLRYGGCRRMRIGPCKAILKLEEG